ncbi:MAG: site-specific DNA-methyltransferase [bacterium]
MTKEKRFLDALRDLFIGAKVDGQSGYINLMRIKAAYFHQIVEPALMADVDAAITTFPDFREELFDKLHAFFSRYFSRSGSICFAYTPQHMSVYEKVYTDEQDTVLFWKTHMLYYVKTDRIFRDMKVTVEDQVFFFDCTGLEHKKANEKRELVFAFQGVEKDGAVRLAVTHSERGRQTKDDEILKTLKKAGHPVKESVLEKAMSVFGRQSEVDYFINKDARGFLREQFDLWMYQYLFKDNTPWSQARIRQLQSLKELAFRLIDFIAQFEDELVRIWNKPKFVRGSHYVITLDRIAAREGGLDLLADLLKHKGMVAQVTEWQELSIVTADFKAGVILEGKGKERKLVDAWRSLPLDTLHFKSLELRLLGLFDDLDASIDGRLIKSENCQALNTFRDKFRGRIKMFYIDPPYNTGSDGFQYRDTFRHASWITMLQDRLAACYPMLAPKGVLFSSIDDKERRHLEFALDDVFGRENRVEEIIWVQNTTKNQSPTYSTNHEYVEVYAKDLPKAAADVRMFREPKPGYIEMTELTEKLNSDYPPIDLIEAKIAELFETHRAEFRAELEEQGIEYDRTLDSWKGLYNYSHAEYRDSNGRFVKEQQARTKKAAIWIWREDNPSMPAGKQAHTTRDPNDTNYRFYTPLHPKSQKPSKCPKRGWGMPEKPDPKQPDRGNFEAMASDGRIVWGESESKVPQVKKFLHEVDTLVAKSVVMDYTDGEKQLTELVGSTNTFSNPKPTTLISRFILQTADENEWVGDFFAGSGTTGHAILEAYQTDRIRRRFLLVETAEYFDTTLLPRIKRVFAATNWKGGKPIKLGGPGLFCKVCHLEQYEEAIANSVYDGDDGDLFRNTKTDPYSQYVFFRDSKMARAIELDYKKDAVDVHLDRLYPDIDLAETLSCVTGKWIKRITADEVEFADGTRQSLIKPDWRLLKPLIFWGPVV